MVELTTVFGLTQTVAIVGGVLLGLFELRHLRQTRDIEFEAKQMEVIIAAERIEYGKAFCEVAYVKEWKDYEGFVKNMVSSPDDFANVNSVLARYNRIGALLKNKILDMRILSEYGEAGAIIELWEKLEPFIKEWRAEGEPNLFESLEWLYNEVVRNTQIF